jgi:citrate synthase
MAKIEIKKGLVGVHVAESSLGFINGVDGLLFYRGYKIKDIAEHATYEEVLYLLWHGKLPNKRQLRAFDKKLKRARSLPSDVISCVRRFPKYAHPMDVLRTVASELGVYDKRAHDRSEKEMIEKGIRLAAAFPTIVAMHERLRRGKHIVQPNNRLSHAANFLYMLYGKKPSELDARVMDVCFILHAEHGLNASAFAARVTASTLADVYAAVTSGIATLKGPLHGGANEHVLKMIMEIRKPKHVEKYVMAKLKKHERIMGFGHRVYKTKDPRAFILEAFSKKLAEEKDDMNSYLISKEIERIVERDLGSKGIFANVDFYSASVYHYLGLHASLYPSIFACSRIAGWVAHIIEQYKDNKIMRPRAVYLGKINKRYVHLKKRK